ncbi:virulence-associated E family protein [Burkholderia ubonensis]|uniref:virulence-associated E family protein n=1 Tax=Burkholderia ubonensis TaxID=101571 RepID=UPI0009B50754|nr:virulence-associated E family protein [Burkholderia ubonensis]
MSQSPLLRLDDTAHSTKRALPKITDTDLMQFATRIIEACLPGGKWKSRTEYMCSGISGGSGGSMRVTIKNDTVLWYDFNHSVDAKGGGLINLYKVTRGVSYQQAATELYDQYVLGGSAKIIDITGKLAVKSQGRDEPKYNLGIPPKGTPKPDCYHKILGLPERRYAYKGADGVAVTYTARYFIPATDEKPARKDTRPWSYCLDRERFICKGLEKNIPLFNLPTILETNCPVLIVEGEKCAVAADGEFYLEADKRGGPRRLVATCWQFGAGNWRKSDFSPLKGRKLICFPDNDDAGKKAMSDLAQFLLKEIGAEIVYMVDIPRDWPKKQDIADLILGENIGPNGEKLGCVNKPWDFIKIEKFIKTHVKIVQQSESDIATPLDNKWTARLKRSEGGGIKSILENIAIAIEGINIDLRYDAFKDRTEIFDGRGIISNGMFKDSYALKLTRFLQSKYDFTANHDLVKAAVSAVAHSHEYNSLHDYLNGLTWDEVPRIDSLLIKYGSAEHDETNTDFVHAAAGRWMIGAVARGLNENPRGVQMDNMLVLEGPQGVGKSSFFAILGGPWFSVLREFGKNGKDSVINLRGVWIGEWAELEGQTSREVGALKAFLTTRTDKYRLPHEKFDSEVPRTCVIGGTINPKKNSPGYLRDEENRRFWCIKCGEFDLEALKRDRDQLWAEAVYRFKQGERWHFDKKLDAHIIAQATREQEKRKEIDPWEGAISDWLRQAALDFDGNPNSKPRWREGVTVLQVAIECLGLGAGKDGDKAGKVSRVDSLRIADILNKFGYDSVGPRKIDDGTCMRSVRVFKKKR